MQKLILLHNGEKIADGFAGSPITVPGLSVSPAEAGWKYTHVNPDDEDNPILSDGFYQIIVDGTRPVLPDLEEVELTPEELRAQMPRLSPVEFRNLLDSIGIDEEAVDLIIEGIEDVEVRKQAKRYWNYATFFERANPFIDNIGYLLVLTPEEIDEAWVDFIAELEDSAY